LNGVSRLGIGLSRLRGLVAEAVSLLVFSEFLFEGVRGAFATQPPQRFLLRHVLVLPGLGLAPYGYNLVLYPLYALLILYPKWGSRSIPAFLQLYSSNELVYNALYTAVYPSSLGVAIHTSGGVWPYYIVFVCMVWVSSTLALRPRLEVGVKSLILPLYLAVWVAAGVPIMEPYYAVGLGYHPSNWPWELGYQVALMYTYSVTVKPRVAPRAS